MSNTTKRALEASLKKLLLQKPLDKITIQDLTTDCGISRMAFYYHFKDIYDLVEWACVEDGKRALQGKRTYNSWQEGLEQIFKEKEEKMNVDLLRRGALFVILCLAQVLVLNHIHLFSCATPLLYVYFIISIRRHYPRWGLLLWGFCMGLLLDTFSNTPGVTAASLTLLSFVQPYLLASFIPREAAEDLKPSIATLGVSKYTWYSFFSILLFCVVFFSLEQFSFFDPIQWLLNVGGSTLLTFLLVIIVVS